MDEMPWIKSGTDFDHIDKTLVDDIVVIKASKNIQEEFYSYAEKFHHAAIQAIDFLLYKASKQHDIGVLDTWFFAVVYLYRHSLELLVKSILFNKIKNTSDQQTLIREVDHNLRKCIDKIIDSSPSRKKWARTKNMAWLYELLSDISSIDSQSDMFRYPFNQYYDAYIKDQISIDLNAIKDNFGTAYRILSDFRIKGFSNNKSYKKHPPKLMISGDGYYQHSVIGYKFQQRDFYPFIQGYAECANYLAEIIKSGKDKNLLFLPMCYLYRNAIELGLKRILIEDCKISYIDAIHIIHDAKHSVLKLWNKIKVEVIEYANAPDGDTTIADTENYISELHKYDSDSTKFRYPVNKNLVFHFPNEKKLSVTNVGSFFNELISFLDAADMMLSQVREWEAEMESEYRDSFSNDY